MGIESFEDLMSAVTFAEAGERETAREFLRPKGRKTVLLAVTDRIFDGPQGSQTLSPATAKEGGPVAPSLMYALNISKRVEASLEVLYVTGPDREKSRLKDFVSEVKKVGFGFSLVVRKDCMKKAILEYTAERGEIMFVIVGSQPELDLGCDTADKSFTAAWRKLRCPLVVVSKAEPALGVKHF